LEGDRDLLSTTASASSPASQQWPEDQVARSLASSAPAVAPVSADAAVVQGLPQDSLRPLPPAYALPGEDRTSELQRSFGGSSPLIPVPSAPAASGFAVPPPPTVVPLADHPDYASTQVVTAVAAEEVGRRPERLTIGGHEPADPVSALQAAAASASALLSQQPAAPVKAAAEVRELAAPRLPGVVQEGELVRRLRLELAPPLLGRVLLEIRQEGGIVTAHAVVDQPATGQVLRHVEAQVQQALEGQGLKMGAFEVSCRDGGQPRNHHAPPQFTPAPAAQPPAPDRPKRGPTSQRSANGVVDLYA
ncbi:MAG: flagellar hook-length control protein FliK, partial [Armatimonadota bacterium]